MYPILADLKFCDVVLFPAIPYSGKVFHGANFRAFQGWVGYGECLKCVYFVWSQHREGAKITTTKISSGGDTGESTKVCTSENFSLYGMHVVISHHKCNESNTTKLQQMARQYCDEL